MKTLRDELAMACLNEVASPQRNPQDWMPEKARLAYLLADEMLKARELPADQLDWPTETPAH